MNIETRRRRYRIIANANRVYSLVVEAAELASRIMRLLLTLILLPFYAVILVANFLVSACILAAFLFVVALLLGWVTPGEVIEYVDIKGTYCVTKAMQAIHFWSANHPNSNLGQFLGGVNTPSVSPSQAQ